MVPLQPVPLPIPIPLTFQRSTSEPFQFQFPLLSKTKPPFKFTFSSTPLPQRPKRARALSDVDGNAGNNGDAGRKKRRLRLHLITSRLSRPFSAPASNIANRGGCANNVVLGGRKRLGRLCCGKSGLRKVAILNRVRLLMDGGRGFMGIRHGHEHEEQKENGGKWGVDVHLREIVTGKHHQNKRWNEFVLPPSPLGRSNYDALDSEDVMGMDDGENGDDQEIYSDFNVMCPSGGDGDDFEYLDTLDGLSPEDIQDHPPSSPSEESIVEMLREEERQHDSYFVSLGGE